MKKHLRRVEIPFSIFCTVVGHSISSLYFSHNPFMSIPSVIIIFSLKHSFLVFLTWYPWVTHNGYGYGLTRGSILGNPWLYPYPQSGYG